MCDVRWRLWGLTKYRQQRWGRRQRATIRAAAAAGADAVTPDDRPASQPNHILFICAPNISNAFAAETIVIIVLFKWLLCDQPKSNIRPEWRPFSDVEVAHLRSVRARDHHGSAVEEPKKADAPAPPWWRQHPFSTEWEAGSSLVSEGWMQPRCHLAYILVRCNNRCQMHAKIKKYIIKNWFFKAIVQTRFQLEF